jgi:hypothetical protein
MINPTSNTNPNYDEMSEEIEFSFASPKAVKEFNVLKYLIRGILFLCAVLLISQCVR